MAIIYPQLDGVKINENRTLPIALLQAIRKAYDYIAQIANANTLSAVVIEDTHVRRPLFYPAANQTIGSFYVETDRTEALYVLQEVSAAKQWVLVHGAMRGLLAARPADLGLYDVGFFYVATDALDYRWSGTAWTTLDTVRGGGNLTNVGVLPKISAAGTLNESAVTDNGTNVTIVGRNLGVGSATPGFGVGFTGTITSCENTGANSRFLMGQSATAHGTLAWIYNVTEATATCDLNVRTNNSLRFITNNTVRITLTGAGSMGFFGAAAAAQQTLNAYTSDGEGVAYTGIATGVGGTPYAAVADLNTLRVAYQNLLASYDDLRTKLKATTLVL